MSQGNKVHRLQIKSSFSGELDNAFFSTDSMARKAAIIFPGLGYTCERPLLHFLTRLYLKSGYDVLNVQYNYEVVQEQDFEHIGLEDALSALEVLAQQSNYENLTIAGKSLGTGVMSLLVKHGTWPLKKQTQALLWLTPLWKHERFFKQMKQCSLESLHLIGTNDRYYSSELANKLSANTSARVSLIEGADHSLEVDDPFESLRLLEQALTEIQAFDKLT